MGISPSVSADGQSYWNVMTSGTSTNLNAVWGTDNANVFTVGSGGIVLRYDGSSWNRMTSNTNQDLNAVWGSSTSNVFAVGKSGTIVRYDGNSWVVMTGSTNTNLNAIWGADGSNIFAAGDSGKILRYNGSVWSAMATAASHDIYGIWGTSANSLFACGKSGLILRYDGSSWNAMTSNTTADLFSVWGTGANDVFAVGSTGNVLHYNGSAWNNISSGVSNDLRSVWGIDSSNVFVAGRYGNISAYDGTKFNPMNRLSVADIYSMWGISSSDLFAVGVNGTIMRYFPPLISSISPAEGAQGAKLEVVIKGNNLTPVTEVRFGAGIAVNGFTVNSTTQITISIEVVAAAKTGVRDIVVTSPYGMYTLVGSFKVNAALPTVASVSPNQERQGAALSITIAGTNLSATNGVNLGSGIIVSNFAVINENQLTANIIISADAVVGPRDVTVTTSGGSFTLVSGFNIKQALPVVTAITPAQVKQGTKADLSVSGYNLSGTSDVRFGEGINTNYINVISPTQLTVNISIAPDAAIGPRDVTLTTPGGNFTLTGGFSIKQGIPGITAVSPNQERQGATLSVTINGTNLAGTTELRFGDGISIVSFNVLSTGLLTANIVISADTSVGTRDVTLTTPGGSTILYSGFKVNQALPVITAIDPSFGNREKSLDLIITGRYLNGASVVSLGSGVSVNSLSFISQSQLAVNITIAPDAVTGTRDVSLTTPGGSYTMSAAFSVKQALPRIISADPNIGHQGATLNISLKGGKFDGASEVRFGNGIVTNNIKLVDPDELSVVITILTSADIGPRDIVVTTPGGSCTLVNSFNVEQGLPVISSISQNSGRQGESIKVIISGSNLDGASAVSFGSGTAVISFSNISPTQLQINLVIHSDAVVGLRDVSVTTPGGITTFANQFHVEKKSFDTLILALIWCGVVVLGIVFLFILSVLRQKRTSRF